MRNCRLLPIAVCCAALLFPAGCSAAPGDAAPPATPSPATPAPAVRLDLHGQAGVTMEGIRAAIPPQGVASLDLRGCDLDIAAHAEELLALGVGELLFEAPVGGAVLTHESTALTLRGDVPDVETLVPLLRLAPALRVLDVRGCGLSAGDLATLQQALPQVELDFSLELCGQTVGPDTAVLNYNGMPIDRLDPFYEVLPLLPNLASLELCGCGASNEDLAALRDAFPGANVVWSITANRWTVRTDATAFATWRVTRRDEAGRIVEAYNVYNNTSEGLDWLRYCRDLRALDLGHNLLTDCTFLQGLPKLEYLILADNHVGDLAPLSSLTELRYLELFGNPVTDLTPLQTLTNLVDLNLCGCRVSDLRPLYGLPLERLWLTGYGMEDPEAEIRDFLEQNPDCLVHLATPPEYTGEGWRTHERYFAMRSALGWATGP